MSSRRTVAGRGSKVSAGILFVVVLGMILGTAGASLTSASALTGSGANVIAHGGGTPPRSAAAAPLPSVPSLSSPAPTGGPAAGDLPAPLRSPWNGPVAGPAAPSAPAPTSSSDPVNYSTAAASVLAVASGYQGATDWAVEIGGGEALHASANLSTANITANCTVTWIAPEVAAIYAPSTPASAAIGTANFYFFYLISATASTTVLVAGVVNGTAGLVFSYPRGGCTGPFNTYTPVGTGIIDSPEAVAAANGAGGSAFLATHPNASKEWYVIPTQNISDLTLPPLWTVEYNSACGAGFEAELDAYTGQVLEHTASTTCLWQVNFTASGLPSGSVWSVRLNGSALYTTTTGIDEIQLANGSYTYAVPSPEGYVPTPSSGGFTVSGSNQTIRISFAPQPGYYNVVFTEKGLNASTIWSVSVPGNATSTFGPSIAFTVPNGSYAFTASASGYSADPASGTVDVSGSAQSVTITFHLLPVVTFSGTGLVGLLDWTVDLNNTTRTLSGNVQGGFSEPNGTYSWSVTAPTGYVAAPSSGTVVVNGANRSIAIAFTVLAGYYTITFKESGLTGFTYWGIDFNNGSAIETSVAGGPNLAVVAANGSYPYYAYSEVPYVAVPQVGVVPVNGANLTVTIDYVLLPYHVNFTETGLPAGTLWYVTLNGSFGANTSGPITFYLANGTFNYTVEYLPGYNATPASGSVKIHGGNATVPIMFQPIPYAVTFTESGLPASTSWSVTYNGSTRSSTTATIVFDEPDGAYSYSVGTVAGYSAAPPSGSLDVAGAATGTTIDFSVVTTYAVTFTEVGLPSGTDWSITYASTTLSSTTTTIVFEEPSGSYTYSTGAVGGWVPSSASGSLPVSAAPTGTTITFTPFSFAVTFTETGLPGGTSWSITYAGSPKSSTTSTIVFEEPNGTYSYAAGVVPGWAPTPGSGSLAVADAATGKTIAFTAVTYTVTVSESGLPGGTSWTATLGATTLASTTTSISFTVPNGTYALTFGSVTGYTANRTTASVAVSGAGKTEAVTYSTSSPGSTTSSSPAPKFLGLPGMDGYYLLGAIAAIVVAAGVGLALRARGRPPPSSTEPPSDAAPSEGEGPGSSP